MRPIRISWLIAAICVWTAGLAFGIWQLALHQNTPGVAANPEGVWPADCGVDRSAELYSLVVLAHPKCPCTVATLAELQKVLSRTAGRLEAFVVFAVPGEAGPDWEKGRTWEMAGSIRGARVVPDPEGRITKRFDAATSGQAILYSPAGDLLFAGGITGSRGHEGDNPGAGAVVALVNNSGRLAARPFNVYGCAIFDEETDKRLTEARIP